MIPYHTAGARTHNLKNCWPRHPRGTNLWWKLAYQAQVKSTLALRYTISEGQAPLCRISLNIRSPFYPWWRKPDIDHHWRDYRRRSHWTKIKPHITLDQTSRYNNKRWVCLSATLFARAADNLAVQDHGEPLEAQTISQMSIKLYRYLKKRKWAA